MVGKEKNLIENMCLSYVQQICNLRYARKEEK